MEFCFCVNSTFALFVIHLDELSVSLDASPTGRVKSLSTAAESTRNALRDAGSKTVPILDTLAESVSAAVNTGGLDGYSRPRWGVA